MLVYESGRVGALKQHSKTVEQYKGSETSNNRDKLAWQKHLVQARFIYAEQALSGRHLDLVRAEISTKMHSEPI